MFRRIHIAVDAIMVLGWGSGAILDLVEAFKGASLGPPLVAALICIGFVVDLRRTLG